jgi:hypothetical protein
MTTRTTESSSWCRSPGRSGRRDGPGGAIRVGLPPPHLGRRQANRHGRAASRARGPRRKSYASPNTRRSRSRPISRSARVPHSVLMPTKRYVLMKVLMEALMQMPIEVRTEMHMDAISCTPRNPLVSRAPERAKQGHQEGKRSERSDRHQTVAAPGASAASDTRATPGRKGKRSDAATDTRPLPPPRSERNERHQEGKERNAKQEQRPRRPRVRRSCPLSS